MSYDEDTPPQPDEPWWWVTRKNLPAKVSAVVAIAVGVYFIGFRFESLYNSFTAKRFIFECVVIVFGILGSVAAAGWIEKHNGEVVAPWAVLAGVFMVFVIGHAAADSTIHRHWNCWRVSGTDSGETVACAPGSSPITGGSFSQDAGTGSSRDCQYLRTGDGKVDVYHCSTTNF